MVRPLLILLITTILLPFSLSQDLSVQMQVPDKVKAGQSFEVKITLDKGSIESFSRFQQDLPYGLLAERGSSANADFSFEDQRVRLIWLKLPSQSKIIITYTVRVKENLKGKFRLDGEFSLVEGNDKKSVPVSSGKEIEIIPEPSVAAMLQVDINDYGRMVRDKVITEDKEVPLQVLRKDPVQTNPREILVEIMVIKGNLGSFAKIEEHIPDGYTAIEGESKNGMFSFENQTVKIIWTKLPASPDFVISYKLIPARGKTVKDLNVLGLFSYIAENKTNSIDIITKNYDLAEKVKNKSADLPLVIVSGDPDSGTTGIIKEQKEVNSKAAVKGSQVSYRIQLAAGHKEIDHQKYFGDLGISQGIQVEYHQGWRKYTVGPFSSYKDAQNYLMKINASPSASSAFISAYYNGKRITVQEALKLTNEK